MPSQVRGIPSKTAIISDRLSVLLTVMVLGQNSFNQNDLVIALLFSDFYLSCPIKMLSRLPFILIFSLFFVSSSDAKCCDAECNFQWPYGKFCHDGTLPDVCCGRGPCNIFCCNCDRGCRGVSRGKRAVHDVDDLERFANYDVNRDGVIDFFEANSKMGMYAM